MANEIALNLLSVQLLLKVLKFFYREVHKRRYLLQPMALEVFSGDGRNYLLAFPRKLRNKVYHRFMAFATGIADSAQQSVAGQKRTANVEQATGILSSLIGETSVTQRWVVKTFNFSLSSIPCCVSSRFFQCFFFFSERRNLELPIFNALKYACGKILQ